MEAINNFGISLTNTSSEKSNNFPDTGGSPKGKSVVVESSSTNFAQNVESTKIPPTLSLPPRPPRHPRSHSVALDKAMEYELNHGPHKFDPNVNIQKLRRTISNKLASQRSRAKKANYILDMEKTAENLKEEVSTITPQLQSLEERNTSRVMENHSLRQNLDKMSYELKIREMEFELHKFEKSRLEKLLVAGGNKHLQDSIYGPQPYSRFQDLNRSIVVSPVGLQLVSNSGASEHSNDERPAYVMINKPNKPLTEEMNESDEMDIDKYLNFNGIDLDPCNDSN